LFDKLYGISSADVGKVNDYLELMGLSQKTQFDGTSFTNTNLSTGQRKRLALICALLEDRPILILDEITSDQDPGFRNYFYTEILPSLKSKGKTILMVSHDDHYTTGYDRLLNMDFGKFV
jgi:putative ATP-binding cassette transporter